MNPKKHLAPVLTLITLGSAIVASGQNAIIEQSRIGGGTQKANPDFVFAGFTSTTTANHSTAPGIVGGISTSSRIAATGNPGLPGTNVIISPNGGNGTISNTSTVAGTTAVQVGTTYLVSVSFASASSVASPDVVVKCADTGMSGPDQFNGIISGAFQGGNGYNKWIPVGYVTPGTTTPTIQFSYSSGVNGRWNVDSLLFSPITVLPPTAPGTYQYWNTGSPGGTGPWDASTANWNTTITGSGTQQNYTQADLADFAGTAGIVTIDPVNGITNDGGLEFDVSGYTLTGGTLTLGSSPSTSGTNVALALGSTATINSVIAGSYGLCSTYGGTLVLGASNALTGTVTVNGGTILLGVNESFSSLAGSGSLNTLNLGANTLTVGSDNTSTAFAGILADGGSSSPGALIKTGTGTLTLGGNNALAGKTTINQGTIAVNSDSGFGTAPSSPVANQLTLNGNGAAIFSAGSSLTFSANRGITLNGASNVIAANTANRTITLLSPITGSGGLVIPTGFMEFDASNSFTGDLVFALTNNVSARFESNGSAGLGRIHIMPQITTGNDPITLRNDLFVNTTITNAIFYDESVSTAAGYYLAAYLSGTNAGTMTFSGNFTGTATGGVTINDSSSGTSGGSVVLSGNNSLFGSAFNLEGGTLVVGSSTALGPEFVVRSGGSTATPTLKAATPLTGASAMTNVVYFNLASGFSIAGTNALEFAGPIHVGASGGLTLVVNNSANSIFSGIMDDQGLNLGLTLNSTNSSILVLKGANTYTGGTTVNSGTLDVGPTGSILGNVTVNGGTLELDNASAMPSPNVTINSPGTIFLNYTGTENIGALTIDGVPAAAGTWGAVGSSAGNTSPNLTGTGILNIGGTPSSTAVTLTTGVNPSTYGSPLNFTAAITGSTPTGAVQFYYNEIAFGGPVSLSGGSAISQLISNIPTGSIQVMAYYTGDANNGPSFGTVNQTINALTVVLTEPYNGTTTATAANLIVANAVGSDVVKVTGGPLTLAAATPGVESIVSGTVGVNNANYTTTGVTTVTILNTVSPFPITSVTRDATGTNLIVCWTSVAGATYNVLTNTGLGNNSWADIGGTISPVTATGSTTCVTIPGVTPANPSTFVLIKQ